MSSLTRNNEVAFNIKKTKNFLKYIIENNRQNRAKGIGKKVSVELIGGAGLGKTSAVLQLAEELEMDFHKINLAQIEELGDLVGNPITMYEINKGEETKWVDEKTLSAWFAAGWFPTDSKPKMSYAPPEWIVGRGESGILLIDDWTRADQRFIQASMELVDRGQYISWTLPWDWHIIMTSNPDNGEFIVSSIDDAQATRFLSINIIYDEECWAEWAEENHIDTRCINFMLMNPEVVTGGKEHKEKDEKGNTIETRKKMASANPRAWCNMFFAIGNLENYLTEINRIEPIGQMAVGSALTAHFLSFIHNRLDKMIAPERMVKLADTREVLKEIKDSVGVGKKYRNDVASILGIRFSNYLVNLAKNEPITPKIIDRISDIICAEIFGRDTSYAIAKKIYHSNKQKYRPLLSKTEFMKYIVGNESN